jgi:acetyl esterase
MTVSDLKVPSYDNKHEIPVRVFVPNVQNSNCTEKKLPLMFYFHGGGWVLGGVQSEYDPVCRRLAEDSKMIVVSVDYRRAPEHRFPAAPLDVYSVFKYFDTLSKQDQVPNDFSFISRIDFNKIIAGGDSAGGTLTINLSQILRDKKLPIYDEKDSLSPPTIVPVDVSLKLSAQVLVYPYLHIDLASRNMSTYVLSKELMVWFWETYTNRSWMDFRGEDNMYFYPHYHDLKDLPPAVVVVAKHDGLRDGSLLYADKLKQAGTDVNTVVLDTTHGFWTMWYLNEYDQGMKFVHEELKKKKLTGNFAC